MERHLPWRHLVAIAILIVGVFLLQSIWPWYITAMVALLVGARVGLSRASAFWTCGLTVAVCWLAMSLYSDYVSEFRASRLIGTLLSLPYPWLAHGVTALIAWLVGGFSGLAGHYLNQLLQHSNTKVPYGTEPRI